MSMTKQLLQLSFVVLFFALVCTPVAAGIREDVSVYMEHVRKMEVEDDSALRVAPPFEVLAELKKYLADPDRRVRMAVLSQAIGVALRNAADQKVRQQVAGVLVTAAKSDPEPSVAGYAAAMPYTFPPYFLRADFTDEMRQDILQLLQQENYRREFILLAGVADVQAAKGRFQELAKPGVGGDSWAAHLALARMGVKDSIEHVVKEFESFNVTDEQNRTIKGTRLLQDLAYTRRPVRLLR